MFNKNFYPTPSCLAERMFSKIDFGKVFSILEPSAGKGDLLDALEKIKPSWFKFYSDKMIHSIEIDPDLRALLIGKGYAVIDSDFLLYGGTTQYDLILANFPFSEGEKHLSKALDILFSGQICCLLNAETIKNPYTNARKVLLKRLNDLNADIEYIENAFVDAERKTTVEVALVYVNVDKKIEDTLNNGLIEDKTPLDIDIKQKNELATSDYLRDLVADYNETINVCTDQILGYFKSFKRVRKYIGLAIGRDFKTEITRFTKNITPLAKSTLNKTILEIKKDYWWKILECTDVREKLSFKAIQAFSNEIQTYLTKEFTLANLRQFVLNVQLSFSKNLEQAIEEVFDEITSYALRDSRWSVSECKANIHYFNAWKTNKGYKINKKFIIPCFDFIDYYGGLKTYNSSLASFLHDLTVIMNYFAPDSYNPCLMDILADLWKKGRNRKIETANFYISIFKKGTAHFEFKDLDVLRRFNVFACKKKGWLPMEYSNAKYDDLNSSQREIVKEFEGEKEYKQGSCIKIDSKLLAIEFKE